MAAKMTDFSKVKTTEYDKLLSKIQKGKTVVIPIINWDKQYTLDTHWDKQDTLDELTFNSELYPSGYLKKLTFTDPRTLKPNTVELEDNKIYAGIAYESKPTQDEFIKNAQYYKDLFNLAVLPGWHTEKEVDEQRFNGHFVGKVIEGDDWKDENGNIHYNTYDNWNLYINTHYDEIVDKILESEGVDLHEFYTVDYVEGVVLDKLYKKDGSKVIAFKATDKCGNYYLTGDDEKELSDYDGVYYWNGCDEAFKPLETTGQLANDFDVSYSRAERMFDAL